MKHASVAAALLALAGASAVQAAPGVGEKVYGATVKAGVTEFEARYGQLTGGPDDGEDGLVLEAARGFNDRFYAAVLAEFEREPHASRKLEAISVEGIYTLGRIAPLGVDVAIYGEYEAARKAPDAFETKLLLQKRTETFDARLNLIAEKTLRTGEDVELGYAASADFKLVGEFRLGAAAFGELGTFKKFAPRAEHFAGPIVKTEIEGLPGHGEIEIETGYLFAIDRARDDTKGQFRLVVEYEFHF